MARGGARPWLLVGGALLLVALLGGALLLFGWTPGERRGSPASGTPVAFPAPPSAADGVGDAVSPDDFVGAETCGSCHQEQYERWASSTHGRAGGEPSPAVLVAPFGGGEIRFADAVVVPRVRAGTYEFVVRQTGREEVVYTVDGVVGGGHMIGGGTQGFVSRLADGTVRFLPFDWSRHGEVWFCNTGTRSERGWVPITPETRLADCGDWPPVRMLGTEARLANCQGCHGSQIRVELRAGEGWRTHWTSLRVNCESCHGPGGRHVEMASGAGFGADGDIGIDPLANLDEDASLRVCFRCHALKDVLREGYLPGEDFEEHYALSFPVLGDDPYRPDGRVRTFAYQATHLASACYLSAPMDCVSCHEPHGQGYRDVNRRPLDGPFDDRQCTSCHASKTEEPEAHSFHPAGAGPADGDGVRCVSCHMPYLQHPEVGPWIPFGRSDHTIPVPRPAFDDSLGVVSACGTCHGDRSAAALQASAEEWWGELKPHRPLVDGLLRADGSADDVEAARLLLRPEEHDPLTQFQALARYLTVRMGPDGPPLPEDVARRLTALARGPDLDVRALALAALHWSRGDDPGVRRVLVDALVESGPEEPLRRRWALALGFLGDRARDAGRFDEALSGYRKALEVAPDDPRVLAAMGIAYTRAGDPSAAVDAFRRSLALDPEQPLTLVNMGIAHATLGDVRAATGAYRSALELNPHEPLAWFNLGNVHQRAGDLEEALEAYRRALDAAPGLGRAHFYAGRILGQQERYSEALGHARRAVEFEPDYAPAREMLSVLERLVDGG